eukprot:5105370-Pleurochrysis_carterae.AAC.1
MSESESEGGDHGDFSRTLEIMEGEGYEYQREATGRLRASKGGPGEEINRKEREGCRQGGGGRRKGRAKSVREGRGRGVRRGKERACERKTGGAKERSRVRSKSGREGGRKRRRERGRERKKPGKETKEGWGTLGS